MQTHQTGTPLKSAESPWPAIQLQLEGMGKSSSTIITFNDNMTNGLDVSYDAGMLKADKNFALYSRLVNDNGVDFSIQALPQNYNELVIPLGIDVPAGTEVTFTAQDMNLPADAAVWLEDRAAGTFTRLDENMAEYPVMISEATKGMGNFFVHTKSGVTGVDVNNGGKLYSIAVNHSERYIGITINETAPTEARVFDMAGRLHSIMKLQRGTLNRLELNESPAGVYVVQLLNSQHSFSEKIVWK
jgi:hypothetical protein